MRKIGIIGHGADKFTRDSMQEAMAIIEDILAIDCILISGHSPVGGIDIWAEETARSFGLKTDIKTPKQHKWDSAYGYKQRNLDIAKDSDELHVILVDTYPSNYKGMTFNYCYHCNCKDHIKSGACWTAIQARKYGKKVVYHIIKNV
jgi:hypothetical protein